MVSSDNLRQDIIPTKEVANPGAALGEAVGKLIEVEVVRAIEEVASRYEHYTDSGGPRPKVRTGVTLRMVNASGNKYQIDAVVEDADGNPLILLESKYIRYTKHNRDKASWTCTAHYSLRKTHPTIRKSMAVLAGNWSKPSQGLLRSFGIDLHHVPFARIVDVLAQYGVDFDWEETDRAGASQAWRAFSRLQDDDLRDIASTLMQDVIPGIQESVIATLTADPDKARQIAEIELVIKTTENQHFVSTVTSAAEGIRYLLSLVADIEDLRDILPAENTRLPLGDR